MEKFFSSEYLLINKKRVRKFYFRTNLLCLTRGNFQIAPK
ncbi:Uncharacterized protein dnm_008040 [Desulfonema magnum]|uniref:Uncharacterized protein n=1 Tax=Desulfonema magnum TaxID=45655 RepID=A0A975BGK0_9BACT|nr:Uncharacterized protein dnm_008040 [Desulfonema magnum]